MVVASARRDGSWRSTVAFALVVAIATAAVLGSIAGLRRTDSALDRFLESSRSHHVSVAVNTADPVPALEAIGALPGVERWSQIKFVPVMTEAEFDFTMLSSPQPSEFDAMDRPRLLEGRMPQGADEAIVNQSAADQLDLEIGDRISGPTFGLEEWELLNRGEIHGEPSFDGPELAVEVVGRYRLPTDLTGDVLNNNPTAIPGPGFHDQIGAHAGGYDKMAVFRLDPGVDPEAWLESATAALPEGTPVDAQTTEDELVTTIERGVAVLMVGLTVFTIVAALAGAVAVTQALGRQVDTARDRLALAAMGFTDHQHASAIAASLTPASVLGVVAGVALAITASPLLPFGVAGRAEPNPGFSVDITVLLIGAIAIIAIVIASAWVVAWRSLRSRHRSARSSPPIAAGWLRRANLPLPLHIGGRHALIASPRVPTRSTLVGAALGVSGIVAALVVAGTTSARLDDPAAWGYAWDFQPDGSQELFRDLVDSDLRERFDRIAVLAEHSLLVDGEDAVAFTIDDYVGRTEMGVVEGRAPRTPSEVALGATTLRETGKEVGDGVTMRFAKARENEDDDRADDNENEVIEIDATIVGMAVLPDAGEDAPGEGAWLTVEGFESLMGSGSVTDIDAGGAELETIFDLAGDESPGSVRNEMEELGWEFSGYSYPSRPGRVVNIGAARTVALAIAALFAILTIVGAYHALTVSTQRRRSTFAVLRTLGTRRGEVRGSVLMQSIVVATVALVVGMPIGLLTGRWIWESVAGGVGFDATLSVPAVTLAVLVGAVLATSLVVAVRPAFLSTRDLPAGVLRSGD
ncbi:MAG TPA: ABC transporter permease [Microthrixaceae bacterium]|nr:ABC transporter permease [Microthrixaceae bacterium]